MQQIDRRILFYWAAGRLC